MNDTQIAATARRDQAHARIVHLRQQLREAEAELNLAEIRLSVAASRDPRAWVQAR